MRIKWINEKTEIRDWKQWVYIILLRSFAIGRAEKWSVRSEREPFFEIEMTIPYLYVYRTEKIERKFGVTGEETTSELISLRYDPLQMEWLS